MVGKYEVFAQVIQRFSLNFLEDKAAIVSLPSSNCSLKCCSPFACSAPGATDRGGDLLHDEEVQVEANDPDPGEAVQV